MNARIQNAYALLNSIRDAFEDDFPELVQHVVFKAPQSALEASIQDIEAHVQTATGEAYALPEPMARFLANRDHSNQPHMMSLCDDDGSKVGYYYVDGCYEAGSVAEFVSNLTGISQDALSYDEDDNLLHILKEIIYNHEIGHALIEMRGVDYPEGVNVSHYNENLCDSYALLNAIKAHGREGAKAAVVLMDVRMATGLAKGGFEHFTALSIRDMLKAGMDGSLPDIRDMPASDLFNLAHELTQNRALLADEPHILSSLALGMGGTSPLEWGKRCHGDNILNQNDEYRAGLVESLQRLLRDDVLSDDLRQGRSSPESIEQQVAAVVDMGQAADYLLRDTPTGDFMLLFAHAKQAQQGAVLGHRDFVALDENSLSHPISKRIALMSEVHMEEDVLGFDRGLERHLMDIEEHMNMYCDGLFDRLCGMSVDPAELFTADRRAEVLRSFLNDSRDKFLRECQGELITHNSIKQTPVRQYKS